MKIQIIPLAQHSKNSMMCRLKALTINSRGKAMTNKVMEFKMILIRLLCKKNMKVQSKKFNEGRQLSSRPNNNYPISCPKFNYNLSQA